jgi:hypothetical protein
MQLSKRERILKALLPGHKVHMRTLNNICYRYSARLYDIRKQGYKIDTIQNGRGEFYYQLVG